MAIVLLIAVVLLFSSSKPAAERTHSIAELQEKSTPNPPIPPYSPSPPPAPPPAPVVRYAIVLDAGSTGSRVHVFRFEQRPGAGGLKLVNDTFDQLKPGLSSYPDSPKAAADSLKPLLDLAVKTVPKDLQATTPISLKATAGLRLLEGGKADKILDAVKALLKKSPFSVSDGAVSILGGQDEGGFAWLTLNYLLGKLGRGPESTVAAIDLGGGSVQEAFAVTDEEAAAAPKGYITQLKGAGMVYNVYVHSYLGYGLMAGRAKVISAFKDNLGHPCFHKAHNATYSYAGQDYPISPANTSQFDTCAKVGLQSLNGNAACGAAQDRCSFDGAWRGKASETPRTYYVSSYFWDRAQESGIITDAKAVSWAIGLQDFGKKAQEACSLDVSSLPKQYPSVKADAAPFFCLDLTYCHTLLTQGFKLPPTEKVTLVKQVQYNGQNVEAAWPLGAAINDLAS